MPRQLEWTKEKDRIIKEGRASGKSWDVICDAIGVGRNSTIERARSLGVRKRGSFDENKKQEAQSEEGLSCHKDRLPMRAGDRRAWNEICRGTCLEGLPYPNGEEICRSRYR